MTTYRVITGALLVCLSAGQVAAAGISSQAKPASTTTPAKKLPAAEIDGLLAPVALYPDQLLTQMLLSAAMPARVTALDTWLKTKPPFTGTALQDAARQTGFEPSLVLLVLFPQVVDFMATNLDWTTAVGQAFSSDRAGVLDSVQRLRLDSIKAGKLKSTSQQSVSLITAPTGEKVIVIEPVNPQVVYVPQYSTQTVYTQAPTSTTVVIKEESNDSAAMAAGIIGFTAGIAIGAAIDNDYYYGPYGWHGGPHMYSGGWDDYYDDREDAREDWYENREDAREDVLDHREDVIESRGDRASSTQQQRTDRQQTRQQTQSATTSSRAASFEATKRTASSGASSAEARGQTRERSGTAAARSGKGSDAFSNYSSGKSERSASARGKSSRSSGGRSRR